ncbi:hypothetical protein V5740_02040 [Croceibacterium sp. TMG7-5b_MA50]|uniref:hypothetical protein n=1 Tax=Croceibacterium sp. TMG7-5b_MA50 TaxID=3121290 RepID=UPI003221678B
MIDRAVSMTGGREGEGMARAAILQHLRRDWPDSTDVVARDLGAALDTDAFIGAAVALQDEGLIMYEALLVGTGPSPLLVSAVLTRKGQEAAGEG